MNDFKDKLEESSAKLYAFFLKIGDYGVFKDFSEPEMCYVFDIIKKHKGKIEFAE